MEGDEGREKGRRGERKGRELWIGSEEREPQWIDASMEGWRVSGRE